MKNKLCLVLLATLLILYVFILEACGSTQYNLTTYVNPSGAGTIDPGSGTYDDGAKIILTANPSSGYRFDHWSGNATGSMNCITVTMDDNKDVIAHFKAQYNLSMTVIPTDAGTISTTNGTYDEGTNITLSSTPATGYVFDHWSGDLTGTNSSVTINMDSNKTIVANFRAVYTLRTSVSPIDTGLVIPSNGTYNQGSNLILTATPSEGYEFDHWSGTINSEINPLSVTIDKNISITANFAIRRAKLSVGLDPAIAGIDRYYPGTYILIAFSDEEQHKANTYGNYAFDWKVSYHSYSGFEQTVHEGRFYDIVYDNTYAPTRIISFKATIDGLNYTYP